jgi:hypothetical protein
MPYRTGMNWGYSICKWDYNEAVTRLPCRARAARVRSQVEARPNGGGPQKKQPGSYACNTVICILLDVYCIHIHYYIMLRYVYIMLD